MDGSCIAATVKGIVEDNGEGKLPTGQGFKQLVTYSLQKEKWPG